jgi:hypothetical protein
MDLFDLFSQILDSSVFEVVLVVFVVLMSVGLVVQEVRARRRVVDFMTAHGFQLIGPISTMGLARALERWALLNIGGHIDGRWVNVRTHRRGGRSITVTAANDLTSGPADRKVTLGAWTRPKLPALLEGPMVDATGRYLRVQVGVGDFVPYVFAAVQYARTLEAEPVNLNERRTAT